jgi:hypothetical protein
MATTIKAGHELFVTVGETFFALPSGLAIPENFFDKGSEPWTGVIKFGGLPLRTFRDPHTGTEHKTGEADTIVQRKQDVTIDQIGGSGTTPIELVALQLRSSAPIAVRVGDGVQRWDVVARVSRSKPSAGHMTITQLTAVGGQFHSDFVVLPELRFTRLSDGEERVLDFGAMRVPEAKHALVDRITRFEAHEVPFQFASPAPRLQVAGLTTSNFAIIGTHTTGPHPVHTVPAHLPQ